MHLPLSFHHSRDSKSLSASKGEPCHLNFTFISQERYSTNEPYEDTGERGFCQISVKNSNSAEYLVVKQLYISSGSPFSIDVAEFLASGANNVMIKVTGEVTEVTAPAFVYTVQPSVRTTLNGGRLTPVLLRFL